MTRSFKLWRALNRLRATAGRQDSMPPNERMRWVWAYFERREVTPGWVIWCHELDGQIDRRGWGHPERVLWSNLLREALERTRRS